MLGHYKYSRQLQGILVILIYGISNLCPSTQRAQTSRYSHPFSPTEIRWRVFPVITSQTDHDTHETKAGDAPCAGWRVWFCSEVTGEQRTPGKRPGMVQLRAPSWCTEDAEHFLSIHLSCICSAFGMPFLQMLPLAFPSRITQIICDNQEKEKYKIHQNKIKVKRKKKAHLSMV